METISSDLLKKQRQFLHDHIVDVSKRALQIDVKTDMPSDEGFKHILVAICTSTGYVDAEAMKTKEASSVTEAYKTMRKRKIIKHIFGINFIISDMGSEFLGEFSKYMRENDIEHIQEHPSHKNAMSIVERAVSMITDPIFKHLAKESVKTSRHANKWVKYLPGIVNVINREFKMDNPRSNFSMLDGPPLLPANIIPVGTHVHKELKNPRDVFGKDKFKHRHGTLKYTITKYPITGYKLIDNKPLRYYLGDNKSISYLPHQVLVSKK